MSRYIDVDDVRAAIEQWDMQDLYLPVHFLDLLEDVPTSDVAPVVHGTLIEDEQTYCGAGRANYKCTVCGQIVASARQGLTVKNFPCYCWNCGARMDCDIE